MAMSELPTLDALPVEIQEAIIFQLGSIHTLKAAAASCRSLRNLVLYHQHEIIKRILRSIIPDDVFPEALAVFKSRKLLTTDVDIVQRQSDQYFQSLKGIQLPDFSLSEAAALEDFHRLVLRFSASFASNALSKHPVTGAAEEKPLPLSRRESYRIQRALYRFELYWNLFKGMEQAWPPRRVNAPAPSVKYQSECFFDRFAPWENEQLACIHDFLLRVIDESYNDVAAHDVEWGALGIPYNEGYEAWSINGYRAHYISLGLEWIDRLGRTRKFKHRRELLTAKRHMLPISFSRGLKNRVVISSTDYVSLSEYSEERLKRDVRRPAIKHQSGPAEVWRVTHLDNSSNNFVMANEHIPLRERGYVMWSYGRLSKWGLLEIPWQRPLPNSYSPSVGVADEVNRSCRRRTEISRNGGSGWWSENDESKVVYEERVTDFSQQKDRTVRYTISPSGDRVYLK
ncbi:hypothetical protein FQN49_000183 [Arthroderma sp. PD_2]|nr:hypothetical protein FQN49_000183 [Arthroderma sp. PD_2]